MIATIDHPLIPTLNRKIARWKEEAEELLNRRVAGSMTPKRQREQEQRLTEAQNLQLRAQVLEGFRDQLVAGSLPADLLGMGTLTQGAFEWVMWQANWPTNGYDRSIATAMQKSGLTANTYRDKRARFLALAAPDEGPGDVRIRIKQIEASIAPGSIPGYFPTPPAVSERMLEYLQIQEGDTVLEPSAGRGDLADAIRRYWDDAIQLFVCEVNPALRELLELKGHTFPRRIGKDFLDGGPYDQDPRFDRICMNPPFEAGQDALHVRRAYEWLAPGGAMVAIVSEGLFFRNDRKAVEFRLWASDVGMETERLPEDAFKSVGSGVQTRIVIIAK